MFYNLYQEVQSMNIPPNFKQFIDFLNTMDNPQLAFHTIMSILKPQSYCVSDRHEESEIIHVEVLPSFQESSIDKS